LKTNTIAIICDCDETLTQDTTSLWLESNGIDITNFWNKISKLVSQGWDPPIAWMNEIVQLIQQGKIKEDTNAKLTKFGKTIKSFKGVPDFITELKDLIRKNSEFVETGVNLECYIISSGIEDLIKGSTMSKSFTDVFGARFAEDSSEKICGIKSSVTFTEKTKFLYAINKGINGEQLRKKPYLVNDHVKRIDRRIPFEHMIYLGDSPSDIPCFTAIRNYGGNSIGIIGKTTAHKGYELARVKRTTVGPYSNDYSKGSDLRLMLETIINKVGYQIVAKSKQ